MQALLLAFACRPQYHSLRSVSDAGYNVHVLGKNCALGLKYSRYCKSYHEFNFDPITQPLEQALAEIEKWSKKLSADIILPSDIISTRILIALGNRLPLPTCALPDANCFDMLNDKWRFYNFCQKNGAKVPPTWLFDDAEKLKDAIANGTLQLPLIVKPHDSMGGHGIHKIQDLDDLYILNTILYKPILIQKLIIGQETDISILANKGKIVAYSVQQNLNQKYKFIKHDPIFMHVNRVVQESGYNGIAHFDGIEEEKTGDIYLIECNPRVWYSIFATTITGLNFVELSLKTEKMDTENPVTIDNKELRIGKKAIFESLLQLITKFTISETEGKFLKYIFADPIGKFYSRSERFNDSSLKSYSAGSIDNQSAALKAITANKIA